MKGHSFTYKHKIISPSQRNRGQSSQNWELTYICKGAGILFVEDKEETVQTGSLDLFPPMMKHRYKFDVQEGCESILIQLNISPDFLQRLHDFFPEYQKTIDHIQNIKNHVKIEGEHASTIIEELEAMHQMGDAERISHVLHILTLL